MSFFIFRVGALKFPLLPMAAFRISSLLSGVGSKEMIFLPLPIWIRLADARMVHTWSESIFSFLASVLSAMLIFFCSNTC